MPGGDWPIEREPLFDATTMRRLKALLEGDRKLQVQRIMLRRIKRDGEQLLDGGNAFGNTLGNHGARNDP